jgi:hypothetical protein
MIDFITHIIAARTPNTTARVVLEKTRLLLEKKNLSVEKLFETTEKIFAIRSGLGESVIENAFENPALFFKNETESKTHIDNAGLVLLHPYLPMVFKELGWTDAKNNFINKNFQQKAILFLQFIINGKSKQSEHLLVLNKILCGWPVALPVKN